MELKTWTRLLLRSATTMRPSGPTATPDGTSNSPVPLPYEPIAKAGVPLELKTWTRLLLRSATAIMPASLSVAVAAPGDGNGPLPTAPGDPTPKVGRRVAGSNAWMRWLPVSAT